MKYIYLGKTTANGYRTAIKVGISNDVESRWRRIDESIQGSKEWPFLKRPVPFARNFEKKLLKKYKKYKVVFKGSGKTEWLKMPLHLRIKLIYEVNMYFIMSWLSIITLISTILYTVITVFT